MSLTRQLAFVALVSTVANAQPTTNVALTMPAGFGLEIYAKVPGARHMSIAPDGTLFVGTLGDKVYAVLPKDRRVVELLQGLNSPNGVAFRDGHLYVGEIHRLTRCNNVMQHLQGGARLQTLNVQLPKYRHHGYRVLRFGPDGRLYVGVGIADNVAERPEPEGTISRFSADFRRLETFARGVRNSMGFDWDAHGALWFTDNGRDMLGDDIPPEELNYAPQAGMHFGFPYRYGNNVADPDLGSRLPSGLKTIPPAGTFQAHVAPLGMRFYRGKQFPASYRDGIFVANHGSWNRSSPVGYRLMFCPKPQAGKAHATIFAQGWLRKDGKVAGRPVDVLELPDGSLAVSDDYAGCIYRIHYKGR